MKEQIYKIIAKYTGKKEFDDDSALQLDLEMDSFQLMSMSLELEKTFQIKIDLDDLAEILTVGDVVTCIEKSLSAKKENL